MLIHVNNSLFPPKNFHVYCDNFSFSCNNFPFFLGNFPVCLFLFLQKASCLLWKFCCFLGIISCETRLFSWKMFLFRAKTFPFTGKFSVSCKIVPAVSLNYGISFKTFPVSCEYFKFPVKSVLFRDHKALCFSLNFVNSIFTKLRNI